MGILGNLFSDAQRVAGKVLAAGLVPESIAPFVRRFSGFDTAERGSYGAGYEAARRSRVRADWTTRDIGPNTLGAAAGPILRARVRDLVRNDPHAARAVEVIAGAVFGTGLVPRADSADERLRAEADAVWRAFGEAGVADLEGQHTLDFLQYLLVRAWVADGEVFVRRRWDSAAGDVPWRAELLESDMLDEWKTIDRLESGGRVWQGIELDRNGRRVAYWFRQTHPGESSLTISLESVRVPAEDVIHLFMPLRPRQLRGIPFLAPILTTKRDLKDYESFELIRKKTEALVVAMVTPPAVEAAYPALSIDPTTGRESPLVPSTVNVQGELVGDMSPGAVLTVENGGAVNFNSPQISANYDTYKKAILTSIAVGCQMTYEDLTGDLSQVNYTSYRAGRLQFNAYIERLQWLVYVPVVANRLWSWCQLGAYLTSTVQRPDVPATWTVPKRFTVEPDRDALADILEIRGGLELHSDKLAARGHAPDKFLRDRAAELALIEKLNLILDADPRTIAFRGSAPAATPAPAPPPSNEGDEAAKKDP